MPVSKERFKISANGEASSYFIRSRIFDGILLGPDDLPDFRLFIVSNTSSLFDGLMKNDFSFGSWRYFSDPTPALYI